jgi:replication-associated recombination protein RarA
MIPLVEKYRPSSLGDFAGMEVARRVLSKLAANPYCSAWLLIGPSGLGKTSVSFAVAEQIKAEIHHLASRQCDLAAVDDLIASCHTTPMFAQSQWHVCIIDEADKMTQPAQLAFLSVLDGTTPAPNTIFLFTCNDTKALEARFQSRCRPIYFKPEAQPHVALLEHIWKTEIAALPEELHEVFPPDFEAILEAAQGNLRTALMTLEVELFVPGSFRPPVTEAECRQERANTTVTRDARVPPVGTVLSRKFRDRHIRVEVRADGFQFEKRQYTSLSAIAKEVAQGNRNGFEFFGLKGVPA